MSGSKTEQAATAFFQRLLPVLATAFASGVLGVAGFAPAGIATLGIVAPALLFVLWEYAASPRRAALAGFAWGMGFFGAGVSWVYVSLHDIGMMPAPLAALATLLFCGVLSLYPAAVGYVQARLRSPTPDPLTPSNQSSMPARPPRDWAIGLLAVPALWTLSEWLRGWLFTGFPWLSLGYSQSDSPLAGYAPLAGVYGITLATAFIAALAIVAAGTNRTSGRDMAWRLGALAGIAAIYAAGFALKAVTWTTPDGPAVSVALAQGNVPQSLKFEPGRLESTLETYRRLVASGSAQLTVLPETAMPRFLDLVPAEYINALESLARERQGNLLFGVPRRTSDSDYTNSVVSVGTAPRQTYAKSHLVPFGEFIPPGFSWILGLLHIPLSDFSEGPARARPMDFGPNLRVAVNICYEDAFGAEIARQLPEATMLVNASNVAWFGDSLAPDQHLQISRLRAMETGRPLLRATNTGATAIIDERGQVLARLPAFTEGLLQGSVQPHVGATPYTRFADRPVLALCLIVVAAIVSARRRRGDRETP